MILVDTNLLLYATIPEYPQHPGAYQWLLQQLRDSPRVGLPWASLIGFVRITINPRIYKKPVSLKEALKQVSDWLSLDNVYSKFRKASWAAFLTVSSGSPVESTNSQGRAFLLLNCRAARMA